MATTNEATARVELVRVRLRGWFRTIVLVPWDEAHDLRADAGPPLELHELRRLIADEPGVAPSLRAMLRELGQVTGPGFATDDELAQRVIEQIGRGRLRVESRAYRPMASDTFELFDMPELEPEPLEIYEDDHHFIEVELLDEAGDPVSGERCRIVLPNGSERLERTDHCGLVRLDRIVEGQCTISFPDLDAGATGPLTRIERQGEQVVSSTSSSFENHWIEVELLDESGRGVRSERCEIKLPSGTLLTRQTDARGLIRIPRIASAGDCEIRFPDIDAGAIAPLTTVGRQGIQTAGSNSSTMKTHWVEVELLDEAGRGVRGALCEIELPNGKLLTRRTDARGLIKIPRIIEAGDCQIRFPDIDAGAVAPLSAVERQGSQQTSAKTTDNFETHWVEAELRDEAGRGVAGALCEITLPNKQVVRRRTDRRGLVRVAKLATPGDCQISFIELDAAVWLDEAPEMLPGKSGLAGGPRGESPSP